jgi:drug/metabolite transporter (DMT)-like permease
MSVASTPRPAAWALLVLVLGAVFIGMSPIFVRLSELGPISTAVWRVGLAVPVFWAWDRLSRRGGAEPLPPGARRRLVIAGLLFAGDLATWHLAILNTSVANATLFASFAPAMVTGGAWLMFGERPTRGFLMGLTLALVGAACLVGSSLEISASHVMGDVIGMTTALFFGAYVLAVKDLRERLPTARLMMWSCLVTALALVPLALAAGERLFPSTVDGALVLLGLALVSQAAGQGFVAEAVGHLPANFSALVILLEPVAAAIAAWIVLSEAVGPLQALGGAIVLVGILVAERDRSRALRAAEAQRP